MSLALDLLHPDLPVHADAWLQRTGYSWRQLESGHVLERVGCPSVDEWAYQYLIIPNRVLWVETHLLESPDSRHGKGEFWRLFDYQKPGMKWDGDLVLQCAAETGKSRDIIGKALHRWVTGEGDQLVTAAIDGNLEELYVAILKQVDGNPALSRLFDPDRSRVKPYRTIVSLTGNRIHFRPAGTDGRALRGLHVSLGAYFDEAAKVENSEVFAEFAARCKPDVRTGRVAPRDYVSTPTGRTDTPFFRLSREATTVPWSPDGSTEQALSRLAGTRATVRMTWAKSFMPDPWWNAERAADFERKLGGVESNDYQHLVLGEDGSPSAALWPWPVYRRVRRMVPEYQVLRLSWDATRETVNYAVERANLAHSLEGESDAPSLLREIDWRTLPAGALDVGVLLTELLAPNSVDLLGVDLGGTTDPTEILGFHRSLVAGVDQLTLRLRVQLRSFPSPLQRLFISEIEGRFRPVFGGGLDAGGLGWAVHGELAASSQRLANQLSGFVFNGATDLRNPQSGDVEIDPETRQSRRGSYKEQATRLAEHRVATLGLALPPDPDLDRQFPGHCASKRGDNARTFSTKDDHLVDAVRVALLRLFLLEHGALAPVPVHLATAVSSPASLQALQGLAGPMSAFLSLNPGTTPASRSGLPW